MQSYGYLALTQSIHYKNILLLTIAGSLTITGGVQVMHIAIQEAQAFETLFPTYTGSMTALIEKCFSGVHLQSSVLTQKTEPLEGFLADLTTAQDFKRGEDVIYRRVLLYDKKTKSNFLYASCLLNVNTTPSSVAKALNERPEEPLGRHLDNMPIEKTVLSTTNRPCGTFLAEQFSRQQSDLCHVRRILFNIKKKPAILIEEAFPCYSSLACPLVAAREASLCYTL
jgi:chorismate-pyruvate lyase